MKYLIKMDKLKDEGISLQKYAKTVIDEKIAYAITLRENMGWQGEAARRFDQKYQKMVSDLYELANVVEKLGSFMEFCSEHYTEVNDDVINKWTEVMEEIESRRNKNIEDLRNR